MRINWFKDENHLVYINGATQLAELERTLHFPGLFGYSVAQTAQLFS